MPAGSFGVIERIEGDPSLQARLTAQGLAPASPCTFSRRAPTYVIEAGHTTIALERRGVEGGGAVRAEARRRRQGVSPRGAFVSYSPWL